MAIAQCPNCGQPVRPGAHYCGVCRTALAGNVTSRAVAAPAVAPVAAEESVAAPAPRARGRRLRTLLWLMLALGVCCRCLFL